MTMPAPSPFVSHFSSVTTTTSNHSRLHTPSPHPTGNPYLPTRSLPPLSPTLPLPLQQCPLQRHLNHFQPLSSAHTFATPHRNPCQLTRSLHQLSPPPASSPPTLVASANAHPRPLSDMWLHFCTKAKTTNQPNHIRSHRCTPARPRPTPPWPPQRKQRPGNSPRVQAASRCPSSGQWIKTLQSSSPHPQPHSLLPGPHLLAPPSHPPSSPHILPHLLPVQTLQTLQTLETLQGRTRALPHHTQRAHSQAALPHPLQVQTLQCHIQQALRAGCPQSLQHQKRGTLTLETRARASARV